MAFSKSDSLSVVMVAMAVSAAKVTKFDFKNLQGTESRLSKIRMVIENILLNNYFLQLFFQIYHKKNLDIH